MNYVWVPSVYEIMPAIVVGVIWWTLRRDGELGTFSSLYQLAARIILVGLLLVLSPVFIPYIPAYVHLVMQNARQSRAAVAPKPPQKLGAGALESNFVRINHLPPNAGFHCTPAVRDWDYVCTYAPSPSKSLARLEFGVIVDDKRVLKVSPMLSAGKPLPSPQ